MTPVRWFTVGVEIPGKMESEAESETEDESVSCIGAN